MGLSFAFLFLGNLILQVNEGGRKRERWRDFMELFNHQSERLIGLNMRSLRLWFFLFRVLHELLFIKMGWNASVYLEEEIKKSKGCCILLLKRCFFGLKGSCLGWRRWYQGYEGSCQGFKEFIKNMQWKVFRGLNKG